MVCCLQLETSLQQKVCRLKHNISIIPSWSSLSTKLLRKQEGSGQKTDKNWKVIPDPESVLSSVLSLTLQRRVGMKFLGTGVTQWAESLMWPWQVNFKAVEAKIFIPNSGYCLMVKLFAVMHTKWVTWSLAQSKDSVNLAQKASSDSWLFSFTSRIGILTWPFGSAFNMCMDLASFIFCTTANWPKAHVTCLEDCNNLLTGLLLLPLPLPDNSESSHHIPLKF